MTRDLVHRDCRLRVPAVLGVPPANVQVRDPCIVTVVDLDQGVRGEDDPPAVLPPSDVEDADRDRPSLEPEGC